MEPMRVLVTALSVDDPVSRQLEAQQIAEMHARYGEFGMLPLGADQFEPPAGCFLVAWADGEPVACGGYRAFGSGIAEIKRMYVAAPARRLGVGSLVLTALEGLAQAAGYREVWLETGTRQPEAICLYRSSGYLPIPCYTEYAHDPCSRCFAKVVANPRLGVEQPAAAAGDLAIRPVQHHEIPAVAAMLTDAARRLARHGIDQWPIPFPTEAVAASVQRGETYLACRGDMAVATLALSWEDQTFWGCHPPDAGYVHRLAVARVEAGRRLGAGLLDWAGREVAKSGRRVVRLDCGAANAALRSYYERAGFLHRRDVEVHRGPPFTRWQASLYERAVSVPARHG